MTKEEAIEILEILYVTYPNFNKNKMDGFNKIWLKRLMEDGNYKRTLRKTNDYTAESKFAPTLADILVKEYKPVNTEVTDVNAMEQAVREEMADPERRRRREEKLKQFEDKLKELRRNGR